MPLRGTNRSEKKFILGSKWGPKRGQNGGFLGDFGGFLGDFLVIFGDFLVIFYKMMHDFL